MPEPPPRRIRAQYASRACDECRRRKVKCSGTEPCQCCLTTETLCRFTQESHRGRKRAIQCQASQGRRKVNRIVDAQSRPDMNTPPTLSDEVSRVEGGRLSNSIQEQQQQSTQQPEIQNSQPCHRLRDSPHFVNEEAVNVNSPLVLDGENWFGRGVALLGTQNRVLKTLSAETSPNDVVDCSDIDISASKHTLEPGESSVIILIPCALKNNSRLAPLIRLFFTDQNNCFYCLDSEPFVTRLSHLLDNHTMESGQVQIPSNEPTLISLAALACMILAIAEFLSTDVPMASRETYTKDLTHQMWYMEARKMMELYSKQSNPNMDIVQAHLIATFYATALDCISQAPVNGAYQAIVMTITSAYWIGLNNESRWAHLSKEEKTARKCLWASIDLMDKQVAYKCGRPYLIQEGETWVSDFTDDIKDLDRTSKRCASDRLRPDYFPSSTKAYANHSFSFPLGLRLQYVQSLVEITRAFRLAWRSFFSVQPACGSHKQDVYTIDAIFQRIQRNIPPELTWNSGNFSSAPKTNEANVLHRVRLLLYTRINVLRLAIHHAAVRGRRGGPLLSERYSAQDYRYTTKLCDDIACTGLKALFTYLNECAPGSCLTTYAASTALECIYHPLAIAQLGFAEGMQDSCQITERMSETLTEAIQIFRKASAASSNLKMELPKTILPIIEGIVNRERQHSQISANSRTSEDPLVSSLSATLPSLKDQLAEYSIGIPNATTEVEPPSARERTIDFNASYLFDPSLLPAPFLEHGRPFDFEENSFLSSGFEIDLERSL